MSSRTTLAFVSVSVGFQLETRLLFRGLEIFRCEGLGLRPSTESEEQQDYSTEMGFLVHAAVGVAVH